MFRRLFGKKAPTKTQDDERYSAGEFKRPMNLLFLEGENSKIVDFLKSNKLYIPEEWEPQLLAKDEKDLLLQQLFTESKNRVPPLVPLLNVPLPPECKDQVSFEEWFLTHYNSDKKMSIDNFLTDYKKFNNLYTDVCRLRGSHKIYFNGRFAPSDCIAQESSTPKARAECRQKFDRFLSETLGNRKQLFVSKYDQILVNVPGAILMGPLLGPLGFLSSQTKVSANVVTDENKPDVTVVSQTTFKYASPDMEEVDNKTSAKDFPGTLKIEAKFSASKSIHVSGLAANTQEMECLLLSQFTKEHLQFLQDHEDILKKCNEMESKLPKGDPAKKIFQLLKDELSVQRSKLITSALQGKAAPPLEIKKYLKTLGDLSKPDYRKKFLGLMRALDQLSERLHVFQEKINQSAVGEDLSSFTTINDFCILILSKVEEIKSSVPESLEDIDKQIKDCYSKLEKYEKQLTHHLQAASPASTSPPGRNSTLK